jgi:hypothetical protein
VNKIAYAALLIAVSLEVQTAPAAQETVPAPSDVAVKKLRDLGYVNPREPRFGTVTPTRCAIPLRPVPVPDKKRFAGRTIPANPSIDPGIVLPPPLPACAQSPAILRIK